MKSKDLSTISYALVFISLAMIVLAVFGAIFISFTCAAIMIGAAALLFLLAMLLPGAKPKHAAGAKPADHNGGSAA